MRPGDDTLMAYADGELDDSVRKQVEQAMQADPGVAARVRQHQVLRQQVQRAYAHVLEAPLPARLCAVVAAGGNARHDSGGRAPPPRPKVVQLDSVRSARNLGMARHPGAALAPGWRRGRAWAALAAALLAGLVGGIVAVGAYHGETRFAVVNGNGLLRAHGTLEAALDGQLTGAPVPGGSLRIGVSFVGRDGQYCRAFELGVAAGLACRAGAGWNVPVYVEGQDAGGGYRAPGKALPAPVQAAIDARAVGPALDARAEKAAAARNWSR
ncbi:anti-sigma factor family protein [Massilia sp. DWR3-1-1]|uniref:anti-sigma factor family protein n=1 Tax=Massilia sp. DWR3-1-1 TaxID=2804559 RepID=UPI003CEC8613